MSENANVGRVFNLTPGNGDMAASVYDPTGKRTDVYAFAKRLVDAAMSEFFENLLADRAIYSALSDSAGNVIQDSEGNDILGRLVISIM